MDPRQEKALFIAAKFRITEAHGRWTVPSQSGNGKYIVVIQDHLGICECDDFQTRRRPCKHILAVQLFKQHQEPGSPELEPVTVSKRETYPQNWAAYNRAQTNEQDQFKVLLHDLCKGVASVPRAGRGRPPLPLSEMLFSAAYKVYSTFSGRRFMSDLRDAKDRGFISKTPHYNSIFNYLENPDLTPILRELITESSLPLKSIEEDFAADSTGFSVSRLERWYDHRYNQESFQHEWVKLHIMCGVKTNIITAVEIRGKHTHDSTMLPPMVKTTAKNFKMSEVSADKGYITVENARQIAKAGATPFIAFRSNTGNATGNVSLAYREMYHYFQFRREEFLKHYHKRSNVEATFSMMKRKFGDFLRSRSDIAMVNEALCKVLCHNIVVLIHEMSELGIEPNFWADKAVAQ